MSNEVIITEKLLGKLFPNALRNGTVAKFLVPLQETAKKYDITSIQRVAMFLGTLAVESGELKYVEEIASGKAYEGRTDLGNTHPGDGVRYKGRGLIQITGRANYAAASTALGEDFILNPDTMKEPMNAALVCGWFWKSHGCNELADKGRFDLVTKRVNGGLTAFAERTEYYTRAIKELTAC